MTKLEKLIAELKRNPRHVRFQQLESVIQPLGFTLRRVKGSHHYYKRGQELIGIVKPHAGRKFCAPQDVKDVLRYVETMEGGNKHE